MKNLVRSRRRFLLLCGLVVCAAWPNGQAHADDSTNRQARPNIVFIFSDDHAFQAIGAYGSKINQTPNLDRLARQGMRFDRCLVTNSICGPSRAVILTGKYSHLNGFRQNGNRFDGSQMTFPKLLQKAGYQTAVVGKWHLGTDPTGFDHWFVLPGQGHYYNPDFRTPEGNVRIQGYVTDVVTDKALEWLENDRDASQPFMLMVQHKAPHRAWLPGPEHLNMFDGADVPEPRTLLDDYAHRAPVLADQTMTISRHMRPGFDLKIWDKQSPQKQYERFFKRFTDEQKKKWLAAYDAKNKAFRQADLTGDDLVRWKYQRYIKDYLRCIASIDDNVGRVLEYLDQQGLADNTIVIYSSDQGFYLGEHGWYDKRWILEESLRTPLIVRWPGVTTPGSTNKDITSNLDFAETFLEIAGVDVPAEMQGRSLVPLLRGKEVTDWRQSFYYHYYELGTHNVAAHYGVVTPRHKLVRYYKELDENRKPRTIDYWDLYDLVVDPDEMKSFYGRSSHTVEQASLHAELQRLRKELRVPED